jgi:hypothetical protein
LFANTNLIVKAYCDNRVPSDSFEEANTKENDKKWTKKWGRDFEVTVDTTIDNWCKDDGSPLILHEESHQKANFDFFERIFNLSLKNNAENGWYLDPKVWGDKRHVSVSAFGFPTNNKKTTYSKDVLIAWPKKYELKFLSKISVLYAIELLHESLKNTDIDLKKNFKWVVEDMTKNQNLQFEDCTYDKIFDIFERLKDEELIKKLLINTEKQLPIKFLTKIISLFGWDVLKGSVTKLIEVSALNDVYNCGIVKVLLSFIKFTQVL